MKHIPSNSHYFYLHIKHLLMSKTQLTFDKPTSFELLCIQGPYFLISFIYKILQESSSLTIDTQLYMCKCAQVLQHQISLKCWEKIWEAASKSSRCMVHRENIYKILMFWYETPEMLHKQSSSLSGPCWHCGLELGFFILHFLAV